MSNLNEEGRGCANNPDRIQQTSLSDAGDSLPEEAEQFLTFLDTAGDLNDKGYAFRAIKKGNNGHSDSRAVEGQLCDVAPELERLNAEGYDIYVLPNAIAHRGYKDDDVTRCIDLFLDYDNPSVAHHPNFPIDPSMIVETSPGKYHYHWVLLEPTHDVKWWKARIQSMLHEHPECDKACSNPARAMRVPGYVNHKTGTVAKLQHLGSFYTDYAKADDIDRHYPDVVRTVERAEGSSVDVASREEADRMRSALFSIDVSTLPTGQEGHLFQAKVCGAMHQCFSVADDDALHEYGRQVFLDWITQDAWGERGNGASTYSESEWLDQWDRMKADAENKVTLAFIVAYARDNTDWVDPRPASMEFGDLPDGYGEEDAANDAEVKPERAPLPMLKASVALKMEFEPVKWLVEGLIPEAEYGLLHGPSGVGKSYFLLQLIADLGTPHKPLLGNPEWQCDEVVNTMYVSYEDSIRQIVGRLKAHRHHHCNEFDEDDSAYDHLTLVPLRDHDGNNRLLNSEGKVTDFMNQLVDDANASNTKLIVIDTLRSGIDCDEENTAYMVLVNAIRKAIRRTNASFLVVHHNSKQGTASGGGILAARGGVALTDAARFVIGIEPPTPNEWKKVSSYIDRNALSLTPQDFKFVVVEKLTEGPSGGRHTLRLAEKDSPSGGILTWCDYLSRGPKQTQARLSPDDMRSIVKDYCREHLDRWIDDPEAEKYSRRSLARAVSKDNPFSRERAEEVIDGLLDDKWLKDVDVPKSRRPKKGGSANALVTFDAQPELADVLDGDLPDDLPF